MYFTIETRDIHQPVFTVYGQIAHAYPCHTVHCTGLLNMALRVHSHVCVCACVCVCVKEARTRKGEKLI